MIEFLELIKKKYTEQIQEKLPEHLKILLNSFRN